MRKKQRQRKKNRKKKDKIKIKKKKEKKKERKKEKGSEKLFKSSVTRRSTQVSENGNSRRELWNMIRVRESATRSVYTDILYVRY